MKFPIFPLLLLFCLFFSELTAQTPLQFTGLKKTKLDYFATRVDGIHRVRQGKKQRLLADNKLTDEVAREALRQQLVNLPAIRSAEWSWQVQENGDSILRWNVEESRTLFPLINFGGVRGNFHFLLGFNNLHFRGRGQELLGYYQNIDGEHNYQLTLRNQSYRGSRWGYLLETRRYAAIEPIFFSEGAVDYRYANLGFSLGVSYSPKARQFITLVFNGFREDYQKTDIEQWPGIGPNDVTLEKIAYKISYRINRIDYLDEKRRGWWLDNNAQLVDNIEDGSKFRIWLGDLRGYQLIGQYGNLAARIKAGLSSNDNTPFAPFVLDSQVNIRGSGNRIDRGTAQLVLNLEYRHTVWADNRKRFAAQLVAFSDFGSWRQPGGSLSEITSSDNFRHFAGGGIRLVSLSAQNALIRLDYGVDLYNNQERGAVLGFGQYF